jgi:hypothetical protein
VEKSRFEQILQNLMDAADPSTAEAMRRGFENARRAEREAEKKPLPRIRGRREDGALWVRAQDVADALEAFAPETNAPLIKKLRH